MSDGCCGNCICGGKPEQPDNSDEFVDKIALLVRDAVETVDNAEVEDRDEVTEVAVQRATCKILMEVEHDPAWATRVQQAIGVHDNHL